MTDCRTGSYRGSGSGFMFAARTAIDAGLVFANIGMFLRALAWVALIWDCELRFLDERDHLLFPSSPSGPPSSLAITRSIQSPDFVFASPALFDERCVFDYSTLCSFLQRHLSFLRVALRSPLVHLRRRCLGRCHTGAEQKIYRSVTFLLLGLAV